MDSSGISTLVRSFVTLDRQGGGVKLAQPFRPRQGSPELTRLIHAIPTFYEESRAVAAFRSNIARA